MTEDIEVACLASELDKPTTPIEQQNNDLFKAEATAASFTLNKVLSSQLTHRILIAK